MKIVILVGEMNLWWGGDKNLVGEGSLLEGETFPGGRGGGEQICG